MKFAEKLKAVLASHPEIHENRRQLQAMYYLTKQNPQKMHIKVTVDQDSVIVDLIKHSYDCSYSINNVVMIPISSYL